MRLIFSVSTRFCHRNDWTCRFPYVANRFAVALHQPVRFQATKSSAQYLQRFADGRFEFVFLDAFMFVNRQNDDYVPLARIPGMAHARFLVAPNAEFDSVADLRGSTVAIAPPGTPMDYLAVLALLRAGLDPGEDVLVRRVEGPLSCVQQVLARTVQACATDRFGAEVFHEQMNVSLRVLGETPGVPFGVWAAHRRVPADQRALIRRLLLNWPDDPNYQVPAPGQDIPRSVPFEDGNFDIARAIWKELGYD